MMLDTANPSRYHIGIKTAPRHLRNRGAPPCFCESDNPLGNRTVTERAVLCPHQMKPPLGVTRGTLLFLWLVFDSISGGAEAQI